MADSSKSQARSGCFSKLLVLVLLVSAAGLGIAVFFITQAQDLRDVGGYGTPAHAAPARELKEVLKNSISRGYAVTLTEAEINHWLGRTLVSKQAGLLAGKVGFERVWVRLEDGRAEIIIVRRIMDHPFTVSMFVQIEQLQGPNGIQTDVHLHGGPYLESLPKPPRGGRFGRLVVPQGFLLLVMPAYQKLAALFHEEIHLAFEEMARIKIEKNRLVLDPNQPADDFLGVPQSIER